VIAHHCFLSTWSARFGMPTAVTTDKGPQFTGRVWSFFCQRLGIHHITTTSFQPQRNGMVERSHRQLKDALWAHLAGNKWPLHLPWVLLGLRAAPKEDTAVSLAELVFGSSLKLPGQLLNTAEPPAESFLEQHRVVQPPPLTQPLSYAQVASSPSASLMSAPCVSMYGKGVQFPLWSLSTPDHIWSNNATGNFRPRGQRQP
jgi:hypothetical protein